MISRDIEAWAATSLFRRLQSVEVTAPVVDRPLADLALPSDFRYGSHLGFPQDGDHFRVAKSEHLHELFATRGRHTFKIHVVLRTPARRI